MSTNKDEVIFNFDDTDMEGLNTSGLVEETPELVVERETSKESDSKPDEELKALQAEYLVIYDKIMFEDSFEKTYNLGKKYKVVFKTRTADADMAISRQLDKLSFNTMHAMQTMSSVLTMSHSLVSLNGKDLSSNTVTERFNYIRERSSHLIELLTNKMIDFDRLVREAMEYGEANF